jgi:hypothetical protein
MKITNESPDCDIIEVMQLDPMSPAVARTDERSPQVTLLIHNNLAWDVVYDSAARMELGTFAHWWTQRLVPKAIEDGIQHLVCPPSILNSRL